ncbi:replication protein P [Erwinia sp. CGal63]|uniref:replication protein P n=1 Tax=Erwinia sp. CGal63 TaxID=2919889 RepID=UPI003008402A
MDFYRRPWEKTSEQNNAFAGNTESPAWRLWDLMTRIYANRWITKNGNRPSQLWEIQIGAMSPEQLSLVGKACIERCAGGNSWPPDFAEFVALVAEAGGGISGLSTKDIMREYNQWRKDQWRYTSTETFPWRHPVLYHICIELKRIGIEQKLTENELKKLAASLLQEWEKKIRAGGVVPAIRAQIAPPVNMNELTPAQILINAYHKKKK